MSNYGMRARAGDPQPWDLPHSVLVPGKVFTDPVHGDIYLTKLEVSIVDSVPFQRLRRVRQLGNAHLVYPGAVHTRFSHSLGALKVVQELLDIAWGQRKELHGVEDDLVAEWKGEARRHWEKVTVLARLGALLHDLCHLPAGHTVEDELKVLVPHDENEDRFSELWNALRLDVKERLGEMEVSTTDREAVDRELLSLEPVGRLHRELRPLIISKGGESLKPREMEYPFCADLVGNTICADLLDYLDRDHLFAGLPESLGKRFVSAFFVTPSERGTFSRRLALNILRDGHERQDIVSELLKALRYRYELSERALYHPAKLSADAMLGESIERWEWATWWAAAHRKGLVRSYASRVRQSYDLIPKYRAELEREAGKDEMSAREWGRTRLGQVEAEVRSRMEEELRDLGDDGLLEFLERLAEEPANGRPAVLLKSSARLARDLRDRRLFRIAERVGPGDVSPEHVYGDYGKAVERAELERSAQAFAGLGSEPRVVLWIPPPDMRLKLAEVLVQQEAGIAPFVNYERSRSRRGSDIYDAHARLWAAYVFVRRDVSGPEEEMVSAYLGKRMGIRWERHRYLGERPDSWPLRLAISRAYEVGFDSRVDEELAAHRDQLEAIATRMPKTFLALEQKVRQVKYGKASP